jgi:CRP-like cAMP-binding protein
VFATLHTQDASESLERLINMFPTDRAPQIRMQLSLGLRAIVCQKLVARAGGGRVAALEILLNSPRIKKLILEGDTTLAILEPGDYFGEMALLDRQPRSASAVAAGPTETWRLSTASFGELHGRAGLSVLFAMIRTAGERIRRLNSQVVVYDEIGKAIGESRALDQLLDVVLRQLG